MPSHHCRGGIRRGYSYGECDTSGLIHPGAELNVGWGDQDLGIDVVACAAGTLVSRQVWDGRSYGFGSYGLVEYPHLGPWSRYAHLDSIDNAFVVGRLVAKGQPIGACGKSGFQT